MNTENSFEDYYNEKGEINELKGYTKTFKKRTKSKKEENQDVLDIISYFKKKQLIIGTKKTEKEFKKSNIQKVYVTKNCPELVNKKIKYYSEITNAEFKELPITNDELSEKLGKPFVISMVSVRK